MVSSAKSAHKTQDQVYNEFASDIMTTAKKAVYKSYIHSVYSGYADEKAVAECIDAVLKVDPSGDLSAKEMKAQSTK
jgi:hypothetical protein